MFRGLSSQGYPKINWHHNLKVWSCLISVTHTVNFYVLLFSIYALFLFYNITYKETAQTVSSDKSKASDLPD